MTTRRFTQVLKTLTLSLAFISSTLSARGLIQQRGSAADEADQPIQTTAQNPDAVAVIIGISQYQDRDDIPPATNAVNDADAVARVVSATLGYKNVITLKNDQAGEARFKATIRQRLRALVQPGKSDVFFYYSGHGMPNIKTGDVYLLPWDYDLDPQTADPTSDTAYAVKDLKADLAKLNARSVTVVLEACFTGQVKGGSLIKNARPVGIEVENAAQALDVDLLVAASGKSEIASDHPEHPHGLMTYYWLRAMRGEAADNQGRVTPERLKQYLQEKVSSIARTMQRRQTPEINAAKPNLELARLPLSLLRTGDATVVKRTGSLEIFIDVGGDLAIDGVVQGTIDPGTSFVDKNIAAGPHHLEVRKQGFETKQKDVDILPDQLVREQFVLAANLPTAGRLDRVYGLIQVSVDRGGTLYVDNQKVQELPPFAPYTTPRIDAGPHRVRVEKPGFATVDQELMVKPNDTAKLDVTLKAAASPTPPPITLPPGAVVSGPGASSIGSSLVRRDGPAPGDSSQPANPAGVYQNSLDGRSYSVRSRGDLGLDLFAPDGRIVAVMDRKKTTDDFKGKTSVMATKCPNNTGKIETRGVEPDRIRMRVETAQPGFNGQPPFCNAVILTHWEEFDLIRSNR
jgi:hypothetical protein